MPNYCSNCGNPVKPGHNFCGKCGMKLPNETLIEPPKNNPPTASNPPESKSQINVISVVIILACIAVWFFAPLAAVNYASVDAQPTGLMLFEDEDYDLEWLMGSPVFWLETVSLLLMAVCMIAALSHDRKSTRGYALLSVLCLAAVGVCMYFGVERDMDYFLGAFGWGFWTVIGLMLLTAITNIPAGINNTGNRLIGKNERNEELTICTVIAAEKK